MDRERCNNDCTSKHSADNGTAYSKYGVYDESFCQYGFIRRIYHVPLCTCLLPSFKSCKKTFCLARIYDHNREYFSYDGELVSFASFFYKRDYMRNHFMERCFIKNSETNHGIMDCGKSVIQWNKHTSDLVLLGYLL